MDWARLELASACKEGETQLRRHVPYTTSPKRWGEYSALAQWGQVSARPSFRFWYAIVRTLFTMMVKLLSVLSHLAQARGRGALNDAGRVMFYRTYAQHLNHWGTAEGVNPLGPLEIL